MAPIPTYCLVNCNNFVLFELYTIIYFIEKWNEGNKDLAILCTTIPCVNFRCRCLFAANVGNSAMILGKALQGKGLTAEVIDELHKPDKSPDKERILE